VRATSMISVTTSIAARMAPPRSIRGFLVSPTGLLAGPPFPSALEPLHGLRGQDRRISLPVPVDSGRCCHAKPRPAPSVRPRVFNAVAMARNVVAPDACWRTMGRTLAAKAFAASRFATTPLACASGRLVRFPSRAPCAFFCASAASSGTGTDDCRCRPRRETRDMLRSFRGGTVERPVFRRSRDNPYPKPTRCAWPWAAVGQRRLMGGCRALFRVGAYFGRTGRDLLNLPRSKRRVGEELQPRGRGTAVCRIRISGAKHRGRLKFSEMGTSGVWDLLNASPAKAHPRSPHECFAR
jgi:hypothetical protein